MHRDYFRWKNDNQARGKDVLEDLIDCLYKKNEEIIKKKEKNTNNEKNGNKEERSNNKESINKEESSKNESAAADVLSYADFFATMPPDNQNDIGPGADITFPQDGPVGGGSIMRAGAGAFKLATPGVYQVLFQVSIVAEGQLVLTLNNVELTDTAAGRFSSEAQIVGMANVVTSAPNAILTVRNPIEAPWAIRLRNSAGGGLPVSAHLLITRLN